MSQAIPEGFHTITPHLVVQGATSALEFYQRAFGALELNRMELPGPDGTPRILHATLQLGDSRLFVSDAMPEHGALGPVGYSPVTIHLYLEDADAIYARALAAGARVRMPMMDAPWGARYGQVVDPFGHHWAFATHQEDVAPEQARARMARAFGGKPDA